jgi:hypothetical protein
MRGRNESGVDNIYIGNLECQRRLITHFNNNLDEIISTNEKTIKQEFFVYEENERLFPVPVLFTRYKKLVERVIS